MKKTPQKKTAGPGKPAVQKTSDNSARPKINSTIPPRINVDELLDRIDLPELVQRAGSNLAYHNGEYRGKCPLHGGDNPTSFQVYQDDHHRWRWKCWARDKGGDALAFVKEDQNIGDFLEAVRWLAAWGQIPFEDIGLTPEAQKKAQARQARSDVLDLAARFAAEQLWSEVGAEAPVPPASESPPWGPGVAYARGRGFSDDVIRLAGFGFLDGSTVLRDHLEQAGADLSLARKLGLIRKDGRDFTANANGSEIAPTGWLIYTHRRRPNARRKECKQCETETWHAGKTCLRHAHSLEHLRKVSYLSARALAPVEPKDKSRNLPGPRQLYKAEVTPGAQEVILCEGQADAESYRQLGFNAWALCGLGSIPPADLTELKRRPVVYIALDRDDEGQNKQGRLAQEIGPLAMLIPPVSPGVVPPIDTEGDVMAPPEKRAELSPAVPGKDMNAWLQAGATSEAVTAQLKLATPWIDLQLERVQKAQPHELQAATTEILDLLKALPKELAPRYMAKVQRRLGMNRRELRQLINGYEAAAEDGQVPTLATIKDGRLHFLSEPLGNFYLKIIRETAIIDGLNMPEVRYVVTGGLATGEAFPEVEVNANEFAELKWIGKYWGARPILYVPRSKYYLVVRAVQEISLETMIRERVYTHTGWAMIDGVRSYLTTTGRITAEGFDDSVRVDLDDNLQHYALPEPPGGKALAAAVRASLDFLKLGPRHVTAPLWAAIYASPLTEVRALYTLLWLYGGTRSGKSTLAHLGMTHIGTGFISGRQYHAPVGWDDTLKHIEEALFAAKDAPIVIDDFAPQFQSARDSRLMHKTAQKVVRAIGNRKARGRSKNYQKGTESPRGMVISTAELPLAGESTVARMIYIPIDRGDVLPRKGEPPRAALDRAQKQAEAGLYAQAHAAFIQWQAAHWERATALYLSITAESSKFVQAEDLLQDRLVDYYGLLNAGQELVLTAFYELGAISEHEKNATAEANRQAILDILVSQDERIAAESPVRKFFEALTNLLEREKIYLAPRTKRGLETFIPPLDAELIGYYDPGDAGLVYLNDLSCLSQVKAFWRALGENFDTTRDALRRQFMQIGGLVAKHDQGKTTTAVWTASDEKNQRLLVINPRKASDLFGAILQNGEMTSVHTPETPENA